MTSKYFQNSTDKVAIGLSLLCAFHCLALPFLFVLIPSLAATQLGNESFHTWMVVAVVPTSAYALTLGCKNHKQMYILAFGLIGLTCLIAALFMGESLGETGEKILTLVGALFIALGHYQNYRLCRRKNSCECHSDPDLVKE